MEKDQMCQKAVWNKKPGLASRSSTAGSISQLEAVTTRPLVRGEPARSSGLPAESAGDAAPAHLFAVNRVHLLGTARTAHEEAANGCSS